MNTVYRKMKSSDLNEFDELTQYKNKMYIQPLLSSE